MGHYFQFKIENMGFSHTMLSISIYIGLFFLLAYGFQQTYNKSIPEANKNYNKISYTSALNLFAMLIIFIIYLYAPFISTSIAGGLLYSMT